MHIYQLSTAQEFLSDPFWKNQNLPTDVLMSLYAKHVAVRFAAECVNKALKNQMEVSNALNSAIDKMYDSIVWDKTPNQDVTVDLSLSVNVSG